MLSLVASSAVAQDVTRHRLHARIDDGVALVVEELTLRDASAEPTQRGLSLDLPEGAALIGLEACGVSSCRTGRPVADGRQVFDAALHFPEGGVDAPLAFAHQLERGIAIRIAGRLDGARVRVAWSARTEVLDGLERLTVPARDEELEVELASASLHELGVDRDLASRRVDAGAVFELSGRVAATAPELRAGVAADGARRQGWARLVVPSQPARSRPVAILLDVSPTALLEEDALRRTLELLLGAVPAGSSTYLVAFARHARVIAAGPVEELRSRALELPTDLGPSTSAIAARDALASLGLPAHATLVWLGDGGLSWGAAEDAAVRELRGTGMQVVSYAAGTPARLGATIVISPTADPATSGTEPRHAREVLGGLFAEAFRGTIGGITLEARAGQARWVALGPHEMSGVHVAAVSRTIPQEALAPLVAAALSSTTPYVELLTLDPRDRGAARKVLDGRIAFFHGGAGLPVPTWTRRRPSLRVCRCGIGTYGGVGRETLRRMIRRTVLPRVRACFAQERAGRPSWEGRATLVLGLEGPEVAYAEVETESPALRACVLGAVDHLVVPAAAGRHDARTLIRYPFFSQPEASRAPEPLRAPTLTALDAAFGSEPTAPPLALLEGPR